jgi:predicted dehydrogenase
MNAMRISLVESIADVAASPRASRSPNRREGSYKNQRDNKSANCEKRHPKNERIAAPRKLGSGAVIIRVEKCRNSRENDSPLFPEPKKTPFRRSSYLVTIRRPAKTPRKMAKSRAQAKRTQHEKREEIGNQSTRDIRNRKPGAQKPDEPYFSSMGKALAILRRAVFRVECGDQSGFSATDGDKNRTVLRKHNLPAGLASFQGTQSMSRHPRREFLKRTAVAGFAAATFTISGTKSSGKVLGANDTIRIAVAGINGRGQSHLAEYAEMKDVQVAYLVDPDSRLFAARSADVEKRGGNKPECVQDLRTALDDKTLDAVSIASPNHWHSLLAIWSCQAGKDVYVEKPCSHNIFEGRKLVEAARKYDRIVQHGTQSRSESKWAKETAAARSGKYGKLLISYGYASKPRGSIGMKPSKEPPKELDFNLWLGPASEQAYNENYVHYNWHWFWEFGNGEIGNQGVHQMDVARWAMPEQVAPKSVVSLGGRFGYEDQGQTPNTQLTIIDFGGPKLFFEDRGLVTGKTSKVTNEFYTESGVIKDGKFFAKGKAEGEPLKDVEFSVHPGGPFRNFIDCVRSRKRENLNAEIIEGHLSARLCHLGNISYRLGKETPFDQPSQAFGDDKAAHEAFESMKEHLGKANKLDLAGKTYHLGRTLAFDPQAEKFLGDDEANQMLTRPYRAPFVVPEQV